MIYRLKLRSGEIVGPPFARYVDAFNYRADRNLVGASVVEAAGEPPNGKGESQ